MSQSPYDHLRGPTARRALTPRHAAPGRHAAQEQPAHEQPAHEQPPAPTALGRVGIIGAGRVGAVLGAILAAGGHWVVGASGSSAASRTRLETLLPGTPLLEPAQVATRSGLLLLTVPDDVLGRVVADLVEQGAIRSDHVVVHTSGRHGVGVLAPAAAVGAAVVAMHPAMTFTGTDVDLARVRGSVCGVTTVDPRGRAYADALVAAVGATATQVAEEQRSRYHAALAHGANHLVTLVAQASGLLRQAGADDPAAVLRPLLEAALDNALAYGDAALTGPVARGDVRTVQAHLDALADAPSPTFDTYLAMARVTAGAAVSDGRLTPAAARAVTDTLDEAAWESTAAQLRAHAGPTTA